MVQPVTDALRLPESCTAILIGPGLTSRELSEKFRRAARRLWMDSPLPVIADASALDWLPAGPCHEGVLRIITPHPGEAARLLKLSVAEVQQDRVGAVRELSRRWANCHVVLKGRQTIVGQAKEDLFANSSGNPYLAQGGSGDLLAGYLGGLLAQPEHQKDAALALRYGVWQHGAAADALLATRPHFTVEELAEELGRVRP
jgi:NAD(P)H-hydrate epimerase